MWPVINSSALIGGKFIFQKNPLQYLLSSVNAIISTNERIEFITGHMTYNPDYTLSLTDDNHHGNFIMSPSCGQRIHFEFTIWIRKNNTLIFLVLFHFIYFTALVLLAKLWIILVCFFMHYRPWQFYDVSYGQRIHFEFQRTQQLINWHPPDSIHHHCHHCQLLHLLQR